MSKVLATFGTGPLHEAMRQITLPAMRRYAIRHGYVLADDHLPTLDPPSWGKIPLLIDLLSTHEEVLWLDSDVLIVDGSEDISDHVSCQMGLVAHQTRGDGRVPNTGVWFLTNWTVPLLREALELYPTYRDHPWWEQAAVIERLRAGWADHVTWLDPGWNRHRYDIQLTQHVRLMHFTAVPDRVRRCRETAELVYGGTATDEIWRGVA